MTTDTVDRAELIRRLHHEKTAFEALIDRLTPDQLTSLPVVGYWTMRDVLAHFIAHEQLALDELAHAQRGETFHMPEDVNDFNAQAVAAYQHQPLDEVHTAWNASFNQVVTTVRNLPDSAFEPDSPITQVLQDTIDGALGNNSYDHYAEHAVDIRRVLAEVG